jgi:hypothetical protein
LDKNGGKEALNKSVTQPFEGFEEPLWNPCKGFEALVKTKSHVDCSAPTRCAKMRQEKRHDENGNCKGGWTSEAL